MGSTVARFSRGREEHKGGCMGAMSAESSGTVVSILTEAFLIFFTFSVDDEGWYGVVDVEGWDAVRIT